MRRIRTAITSHPVALAGVGLAWLLVLVVPGDYGVITLAVAIATTGAVAALVGPSHPLRNGTLAGLLPVVAAVAVLVGQIALGSYELAEGETWGSFWAELPFWFLFVAVPAALLGLLGGSIVGLVRQANLRMHPR